VDAPTSNAVVVHVLSIDNSRQRRASQHSARPADIGHLLAEDANSATAVGQEKPASVFFWPFDPAPGRARRSSLTLSRLCTNPRSKRRIDQAGALLFFLFYYQQSWLSLYESSISEERPDKSNSRSSRARLTTLERVIRSFLHSLAFPRIPCTERSFA